MTDNKSAKPEKKSGKGKIVILVIVAAILLIINGVQFFLNQQEEEALKSDMTEMSNEKAALQTRLESISNELDMKIEEIRKLGGDVEELEEARNQLEQEREQLRKASNAQIARLRNKVGGYEELLKAKDEEIVKLKAVNDELLNQNTELKTTQNQLSDSLSTLSSNLKKQAEKVEVASRLKAENVKVYGVNSRGKEREGEFRNRQVEQLKVSFNLERNDVAPMGGRDIKIRVIDPDGNVIFDVAKGSGSFMYNGREAFFTSNQQILFDNTEQEIVFVYDKGSEYTDGNYRVEIFADDYVIGESEFLVK
ncbi:chromosome segregation protein SMC [Roseivirga sp. BDSF3-8]|uniref:chromosome segregation protein SMC n=1 Tax=Roseivirga sp. BDSF3-8 TaxID=3241598 RepID=UPI0035322CC9